MLYAAAVLLCLTVLPFLIGLLKGLAGKGRMRGTSAGADDQAPKRSIWGDGEDDRWNPLDARIDGLDHC